jgi:hypothetical protein
MSAGIVYYLVREAGPVTRDLAIHRVADAAVACLQKLIQTCETENGFDMCGVTTNEYGLVGVEWLIYSYRPGDNVITCHGSPAVSRDYIFRQPGLPVRPPSSSRPWQPRGVRQASSQPDPPSLAEI